ncbi:hypothetical protein, partial [Pseudanabaena mucicola]|uniref:hypothetical protein n=1 Tax=Pseudanabaena mucicola TaxID=71190 RepID=UPI001A7E4409
MSFDSKLRNAIAKLLVNHSSILTDIAQLSSHAELFTHIRTNGKILRITISELITVRLIEPL